MSQHSWVLTSTKVSFSGLEADHFGIFVAGKKAKDILKNELQCTVLFTLTVEKLEVKLDFYDNSAKTGEQFVHVKQ